MTDLANELAALFANQPFDYAYMVTVPGESPVASVRATQTFRSASLIKIGIADYLGHQSITAPHLLEQTVAVQPNQRVGGSGVLFHLSQSTWSVGDLLDLMLCVSDNTATNVLLDHFGLAPINQWLQARYPTIQLGRRMMTAADPAHENLLTLTDLLPLWNDLLALPDPAGGRIRTALQQQQNRQKLPALADAIGFSGTIFNKTGELLHEEHDAARFIYRNHMVDCVLLTSFPSEKQRSTAIIAFKQFGRIVMSHLKNVKNNES
jgi:beta-lactamase class A